eukprot:6177598-Pleurochrysis_carterae.AAC.1
MRAAVDCGVAGDCGVRTFIQGVGVVNPRRKKDGCWLLMSIHVRVQSDDVVRRFFSWRHYYVTDSSRNKTTTSGKQPKRKAERGLNRQQRVYEQGSETKKRTAEKPPEEESHEGEGKSWR